MNTGDAFRPVIGQRETAASGVVHDCLLLTLVSLFLRLNKVGPLLGEMAVTVASPYSIV